MLNKVKIPKRKLKGDDGHKIFSIRIPDDLYEELNSLASKTELSRNEIITILLKAAIDVAVIEDAEK
ncbi:Ribbon-helix-helix protein%2C copG family [uncultured Eubacterium sp.]|nr:Ribbon-helix-helix protein%2C copG family [uncultured Eubacterium sp.]